MRILVAISLVVLTACVSSGPTAPTDNPKEMFILAETQRLALILGKKITAEVTDKRYMVSLDDGSKVPAAGWYNAGHIEYWRPFVLEYPESALSEVAAHEVCHSQDHTHGRLWRACFTLMYGYL